jgi:hypothetical protein
MADTFAPIGDASPHGGLVGLWTRRTVMTLLLAFPVLGALNVFGQEPTTSSALAPAAQLSLDAPKVVRGGLMFQSRVEVHASRRVDHLRLVLDDGWFEGMQIGSIEPQPADEESRDGRVVLTYGRLRAGDRLVVWVQSQVNPTDPGRRKYGLLLQDATSDIARIDRTITVLP